MIVNADEIARHVAPAKQMQAEAIACLLTRAFWGLSGLFQRRSAERRTPAGHKPTVPHGA